MCNRQATLVVTLLVMILGLSACQPSSPPLPPGQTVPPPVHATSTPTAAATFTAQPPLPTGTVVPATATPPACIIKKGGIVKAELDAQMLTWPLRLNIYLPPCYSDDPQARFPVLYLLHGQDATQDQWLSLGVAAIADRMITSGEFPPFIIVMPFDKSYKQPNEDRFGEALTGIVIPYVDSAYRTQADRSARAIGGLSRGGAWAIHLGLTRPSLFSAIGAHSPAIFVNDAKKLEDWMAGYPADQRLRVFMDIGNNDTGAKDALNLENLLTQFGVEHEWHFYLGWHTDVYWKSHVEEYLRWYAAGWQGTEMP